MDELMSDDYWLMSDNEWWMSVDEHTDVQVHGCAGGVHAHAHVRAAEGWRLVDE